MVFLQTETSKSIFNYVKNYSNYIKYRKSTINTSDGQKSDNFDANFRKILKLLFIVFLMGLTF